MGRYRVEIKRSAARELERLEPRVGRRALVAIEALAEEQRPRGCRKLRDSRDSYRLRIGDYRAIYQVDDQANLVIISAFRHRREAYR